MISITALIADPTGTLTLREDVDSGLNDLGRRVRRTPTMDGGAAIFDGGFSDADRTLTIRWKASLAEFEQASRLIKVYSRLRAATMDGVYVVAPSAITKGGDGVVTLTLLVIEKESV